MKILALDLGKFKSVACHYDSETREAQYEKIKTAPMVIHQVIVRQAPQRIVFEIGPSIYERVRGGSKKRSRIAIVAVARRLLVTAWAMLRDGTSWRMPPATEAA